MSRTFTYDKLQYIPRSGDQARPDPKAQAHKETYLMKRYKAAREMKRWSAPSEAVTER